MITEARPEQKERHQIRGGDTDSVEPLERPIGSVTFHVEVTHPSASSTKNSAGRGRHAGGTPRTPPHPVR
jgi:hypothetical protein